jgi:hypothetical protein
VLQEVGRSSATESIHEVQPLTSATLVPLASRWSGYPWRTSGVWSLQTGTNIPKTNIRIPPGELAAKCLPPHESEPASERTSP